MATDSENSPKPDTTTPPDLKWVYVAYPVLEDLLELEDLVATDSERGRVEKRIQAGHAYMLCNQRVVAIVRILRGIAMCRPARARLKSILNASPEWGRDLERDIVRMGELGERLRIRRSETYAAFLNDLPVRVKQARKNVITPDVFYAFISEGSPEFLRTVFDELQQADELGKPEGESPQQYVGELLIKGREVLGEKLTKEQILDQYVVPELASLESISLLARDALKLIRRRRKKAVRPFSEDLYRWEKSYKDRLNSKRKTSMPR